MPVRGVEIGPRNPPGLPCHPPGQASALHLEQGTPTGAGGMSWAGQSSPVVVVGKVGAAGWPCPSVGRETLHAPGRAVDACSQGP